MPSKVLKPHTLWTTGRGLCAIAFLAFILHYSAGTIAWTQSIRSDWPYISPLGGIRPFWTDVFAPAFQCALLLLVSTIGLLETICAYRRAPVWLTIVVLGSLCAFAIDATFCRYQYSVDIATSDYWAKGGFAHVYYTWWWYNDHWFGVPWYRDAG